MSARSVCNGTRPSRYHSMRAISEPPSRPAQLMRMPSAPMRMADCTARFMARRNATRRSSCWAMPSATRVASTSGLRTSTMFRCTSESVLLASSRRSFSMSAPFLPMRMPGRAVYTVTRHFLCGRSMTTLEIPACLREVRMCSRIFKSSCSSCAYSAPLANQRESQVRLTPSLSPIGLTFCPSSRLLDLAHDHCHLREWLIDARGPAARSRAKPLQDHVLAHIGLGDDQRVDIEVVIVLGVGNGRLQRLLHVLGDALTRKSQIGERAIDLLAPDQLGKQVELLRAHANVPGHGLRLAVFERALALRLAHYFVLFALRSATWPWNVRVGENSPNLCPTMSSVTRTGMCFWPL